jgi:protein O-GlcNAc transferase
VRLPDCWVAYDPLTDVPPRPAEQTGPITFGCLNNPAKLNEALLKLWARALHATSGSRLMLRVLGIEHRKRIMQMMEGLGIDHDRLAFVGWMNRPEYLRAFDKIDIALDPLPYNGITTTCDALYMGTPVLTLVGQTAAGRAGKAMLTICGLDELIANTSDEFVQKASELARDLPRLTQLRASLRQRLRESPLMDAPRFARNMESAYRKVWKNFCANPTSS